MVQPSRKKKYHLLLTGMPEACIQISVRPAGGTVMRDKGNERYSRAAIPPSHPERREHNYEENAMQELLAFQEIP
jgi:hypothetical protein